VREWCIDNVVGHDDARSNVYPRKARPEQKIDAAIALIMALGRTISGQAGEPDMSAFLADPIFL
jgi:phage terminase large subunit-like protein